MDFDTTTMLEAAKRIPPAPGLVTQLLIGDKIVYVDSTKVDQDFIMATRKLSPVVSRKIGGKIVTMPDWLNYVFTTPNCAPRWVLDDEFLQQRMPGEPTVGGMSVQDRQEQWIGMKIAEGRAMTSRRVEWMGCELVSTGVLTITGDGYSDEIDLGQANHETLAGDNRWDQSDGDPLTDLDGWISECLADSGVTPNICVMGTSAAGAFLANTRVAAAMDTRNYVLGRIEPKMLPDGARYVGYLSALDLEIYCHGGQYESDAGVMTPYIAADRVTLFPSADRNSAKLIYGAVRDAKLGQWFLTDLYPRRVVDEDSNVEYIETISRPLVIFVEIHSWYWADVV